jgi:hypothetical protein
LSTKLVKNDIPAGGWAVPRFAANGPLWGDQESGSSTVSRIGDAVFSVPATVISTRRGGLADGGAGLADRGPTLAGAVDATAEGEPMVADDADGAAAAPQAATTAATSAMGNRKMILWVTAQASAATRVSGATGVFGAFIPSEHGPG